MTQSIPSGRAGTVMPASFCDPDGYLFQEGDALFRAVNESYREHYEYLFNSGLYDELVERRMLVYHEEVDPHSGVPAWRVIRPEQVAFISYPYEWCFGQIKDAALLMLDIQLAAIEHGMSLKDASAYNIQFHRGRPIMIDTLSFERYEEGKPWPAYRQFCRHFLAPLALMAKRDVELNKLLIAYIDGIPLALAGKLPPRSSRLIWVC